MTKEKVVDQNFEGKITFGGVVNYTTGETCRFRGKNFLTVSPEETGGGTTSDISGFTSSGGKFNHADNVLYKTGFGFQGYNDFDDTHTYFQTSAYVAGEHGINLFVNSSLKARFNDAGTITFYDDLTLDSSDITAVNLDISGNGSIGGDLAVEGAVDIGEANSGVGHYLQFWDPIASTQARMQIGINSDGSSRIYNSKSMPMIFYVAAGEYHFTGWSGTKTNYPLKIEASGASGIAFTAPASKLSDSYLYNSNESGKEAAGVHVYVEETGYKLKFRAKFPDGTYKDYTLSPD